MNGGPETEQQAPPPQRGMIINNFNGPTQVFYQSNDYVPSYGTQSKSSSVGYKKVIVGVALVGVGGIGHVAQALANHAIEKYFFPIVDQQIEQILPDWWLDIVDPVHPSPPTVFDKLARSLDEKRVKYETEHHEAVVTSEEAAKVRGVSMHAGAKALVMRGEKSKQHWLFVMPADLRADTKKIQAIVGERVSFAPDPEAVTGCVKGSVPPFGSVVDLKTYCDPKLADNEIIHFNAGSLTDSVSMKYTDYLAVENPELRDITSS